MIVMVACELPDALAAELEEGKLELTPVALSCEIKTQEAGILSGPLSSFPVRPTDVRDIVRAVQMYITTGELRIGLQIVPAQGRSGGDTT